MGNSAEWGCKEPFEIDDGELDGLSPQKCFVLGVEWQMFAAQCDAGESFTRMVHSINSGRLARLARRRGLSIEEYWVNDDWVELTVGRK